MPTIVEIVMILESPAPEPLATTQSILVEAIQMMLLQCLAFNIADDVKSLVPKFAPNSSIVVPPVVAELDAPDKYVSIGASKVYVLSCVPTTVPTSTRTE